MRCYAPPNNINHIWPLNDAIGLNARCVLLLLSRFEVFSFGLRRVLWHVGVFVAIYFHLWPVKPLADSQRCSLVVFRRCRFRFAHSLPKPQHLELCCAPTNLESAASEKGPNAQNISVEFRSYATGLVQIRTLRINRRAHKTLSRRRFALSAALRNGQLTQFIQLLQLKSRID